jgi:putative ABC transport system ATP-binding protein
MDSIAICCKGIKKSYGEDETRIDALRGVDLEISQGELTLLVGPSGSGKSTLLSVITTILKPDEGELYLLGHDMGKMPENQRAEFCRRNLGIVFQSLFLIPTLSVAENVSLPLLLSGKSQDAARLDAMAMLERMGIAHRSEVSPAHLSKGQQQKVAIARAIINNSKILVCDEPTSSLDQHSGHEIMEILRDLALQATKTVLVVTHDHRIFSFADRIVNMNDGQIVSGNHA